MDGLSFGIFPKLGSRLDLHSLLDDFLDARPESAFGFAVVDKGIHQTKCASGLMRLHKGVCIRIWVTLELDTKLAVDHSSPREVEQKLHFVFHLGLLSRLRIASRSTLSLLLTVLKASVASAVVGACPFTMSFSARA